MATSPYHISSLLDKMSSVDKDFRFMATNDLMTELQRDSIKLDDDSERKVVLAILKLVQDKNGEVQNLAVRCLGPLIRKVKDVQVEVIVNELCANMFSEDERLRDISSVGLKTVIGQLPQMNQSTSNAACRNITDQLVGSIGNPSLNQYVLLECLDILGDLVHTHGTVLISYHQELLHSLLPMLLDPRPISVRKRACTALCYLSSCCTQELYDVLLTQVIKNLSEERHAHSSFINVRTFLHCVGAISRQSGQRINSYLPAILPLLMHFVSSDDDELKEACLQAFEVLVCFREISTNITEITDVALRLLAHDPNYHYDTEEESDEEEMETDDPDQEEDDSYSDDDDISWKVRRASAKCVSAIVTARPDLLGDFYSTVSPALINRFKEREESVKADIFQAYRTLLQVTKSSVGVSDNDSMETGDSPLSLLVSQVPSIVKALHRQLRDKSIKTRQGCFTLLTDLVLILHESLKDEMGSLVPGIVYCLNDTSASSNMRIDCLVFLMNLCMYHPPSCVHPHIPVLMPAVIKCVGDSFYKITSEALLVLQNLVKVIRPLDVQTGFDYSPYADGIFTAAIDKLSAADIDQEVKERAITCMGQIIANLGDVVKPRLPECLPLYVNRLKNEITRLTTVKALTMITRSSLKIDISSIQLEVVPLLATFLRKNHRDLRLATLVCLNQLLTRYSIPGSLVDGVLAELPQLITDNDLHVSQQVLTVVCSVMTIDGQANVKIKDTVLPNVMSLLQSSLLQGNALNTVANFFSQLVRLNQPGLQFEETFQMLVKLVDTQQSSTTPHRQTFHSISRCIAVMCLADTPAANNSLIVVQKFVKDIENSAIPEAHRLLALFTIGEIGKHTDLSPVGTIENVVINMFGSSNEETRSAASYALGCVCAGNLEKYLPFILTEIQSSPKKQYLLLHSLKEIIACYSTRDEGYAPLKPYVEKIWDVLFLHFQTVEEGTRNVVAECVGKLILVEPAKLLPLLKANLESDLAHVRSTVITALKYTISDQPQEVDVHLSKYIGQFMSAIADPDINVRRVALVAFNSAAHNKPSLIRDLLDTILPNLYNETKVRKELIRQVEMGPFKHTVDDGLDLRKAAFECMYTLLETCLARLDIFEFLSQVENGLRDHYDIKMLTFLLLVRVSLVRPSAVLQHIDRLVEPLKATVQSKVKANSVKQEFEKQEEIKRSALRTVVALLDIPDAGKNPQLMEFLQQIKSNSETAALFQSVQLDSSKSKAGNGPGMRREEPMEL